MTEEKKEEKIKKKIEEPSAPYLISRVIEMLCIGAFIFGFLWNGTEVMNLTTPQFMMMYGGSGAAISEVVARIIKKKTKYKVNKNRVTISLVLSIYFCLIIGVYIMYDTKAFWGKESNSNINTINWSMNTLSSTGLLSGVFIVIVIGIAVLLVVITRAGFEGD